MQNKGIALISYFRATKKNIAPTNINLLLFLRFVAYVHVSLFKNYSQKAKLRVSLPKTGPLPFGSENQFPLNFAHEYILVQK